MSTRNIRKLLEKLQVESKEKTQVSENVAEFDSFEPLYTEKPGSVFSGLPVSSSSPSEADEVEPKNELEKLGFENEEDHTEAAAAPVVKKKKNKNNRKKKNKNKIIAKAPKESPESSDNDDEVARVVAEVNELLGEPPAPPEAAVLEPSIVHLSIDHKHLNMATEMTRMFGPDTSDRANRRGNVRHTRRHIVLPKSKYECLIKGLSMRLIETKADIKYFKFEHGQEYQKRFRGLLSALKLNTDFYGRAMEYEIYQTTTLEAMIQNLWLYFTVDEATAGVNAVEQAIYCMQNVFDLSFNYIDGKTRLEYVHVENRAFHVVLLMYLHVLTNKACHRTALEIAKLMLNLDPTDPLGVIFMVDTLALRAREHQWLVDIYAQWTLEKEASRLFHVRYSYALALYHLYLMDKDPQKLERATRLLKRALMKFPNVCLMLMNQCQYKNEIVTTSTLFTRSSNTTSADVQSLQKLYVKFVWPRWRESNIMDWVVETAVQLIAQHKYDGDLQASFRKAARERARLFRRQPIEMKRHLSVIGCMSELIADGEVPKLPKTMPFNPYPSQGRCIDVHHYYKDWGVPYPMSISESQQSVIRSFITSLLPETSPPGNAGGFYKFEFRGLNRLGDFYYDKPWWSFEVQEDRRLDDMPRIHMLGGFRDLEIRVLQRYLLYRGTARCDLPSRRPHSFGPLFEGILCCHRLRRYRHRRRK